MKPFKKPLPFLSIAVILLINGCAGTKPLKGVNASGEKVYLGSVPIENTTAFQDFMRGSRTEIDKQRYLFRRLKDSSGLEFCRDNVWYNRLEAYRGGMWLMRNRYQKGQDTRTFININTKRSDKTGQYHLIRYPDGSVQIGFEVLLNELDLLEKTAAEYSGNQP